MIVVAQALGAGDGGAGSTGSRQGQTRQTDKSAIADRFVGLPGLTPLFGRADVWGIKWLAATSQELYRAKHLWAQVDFITEHGLLQQWHKLEPENELASNALLEKLIDGFSHSEHEWPAGILYGMNGANLEQCREIEGTIGDARVLDVNGKYTTFLADFQEKLNIYVQRLR